MEIPDELIESLIPAVKQQIESADTPYVKKTYDRLTVKNSMPENDATELIAQALAIAVNRMMITGRPFDTKTYQQLLDTLPALPDESDS